MSETTTEVTPEQRSEYDVYGYAPVEVHVLDVAAASVWTEKTYFNVVETRVHDEVSIYVEDGCLQLFTCLPCKVLLEWFSSNRHALRLCLVRATKK